MPDPFTVAIGGYIAINLPHWLKDLRATLFDKGKTFVDKKGKGWLNEKEQQRRLQQAIEKAVQRGLANFQNLQERDRYRDILQNLFEPGVHSDNMRRAAMTLFSFSDNPNITELNEIYNRSLRIHNLSQPTPPTEVDAAPYLTSFFNALKAELYADSFFKNLISDTIQTRAAAIIPQHLAESNTTLHKIHEAIKDDYTEEQFQQDIKKYNDFMEQALHTLKIIGVVPKDQNRDPDLNGIFVPLRIGLTDQAISENKQQNSLVTLLEQYPLFVLLGDPGSGKSTSVRHLAWSHAKANQKTTELDDIPLLPDHPLPLRIELRLLVQDRKHHPDYSFLSYATEVLLGREGIKVNLLMFEKLLAQKRMLILFDGLDEVTTLDERQRLVQEIEHFAQLYPGNHILVTSRPVGYELAGCSKRLFVHARVQVFDNDQIHQFLERWYKYVLRLSPLPYEEQQEIENLFSTLKDNSRLHKLAENPLLLTVIAALYRSQRLPEKRVQVYDKCAELLLETWAKHKGTDVRWADIKMGKEDQFACVAHLGYRLHKRSQEENDKQTDDALSDEDTASDVPARFMLREIESFLKSGKLITGVAEQRKEAEFFLDLMRIEAGLIVERGTDESGESIYGFVHRTFQEYFAASDVYERFRQNEDSIIINDFLVEHLHDPHWHEVILLLLGKLGRRPVTVRLRQILDGKIKSRRSSYTDVLQQDLFFVCDCLAEETPIENDLAELVISRLCSLIKTSLFSSQRGEALEKLANLLPTKQFEKLARRELIELLTVLTDISLKIDIAQIIYLHSAHGSEERQEAAQVLLGLAQYPDLSVEQIIRIALSLYRSDAENLEERQEVTRLLLSLTHRPDLSVEQIIRIALALHQSSLENSEERQEAIQLIQSLEQRIDLSIEQAIQAIHRVYMYGSEERRQLARLLLGLAQRVGLSVEQVIQVTQLSFQLGPRDLHSSEERREATQLLLHLAHRPDLSIEQTIQAAQALYQSSSENSKEQQEATQLLMSLAHRPNLSIEQTIQAAQAFYYSSSENSKEQQEATQLLMSLAHRSDLSIEQTIQAAQALYRSSSKNSDPERQAIQLLMSLAHHSDLSIEQAIQTAQALYQSSSENSKERQEVAQLLLRLAHRPDLSNEQTIQVVQALYHFSSKLSEERQEATRLLMQLAQNKKNTMDQRLFLATIPIADLEFESSCIDKWQAFRTLLTLLSTAEIADYLKKNWELTIGELLPAEIPYAIALLKEDIIPHSIRNTLYESLEMSVSQFNKISAADNKPYL